MSEMILPGVYIEVRPEALIVPGRVSVNTVGIVGTASRGPVNTPVLLASYSQAREIFGEYDAWDEDNPDVLSLTRALELAFGYGATQVWVALHDALPICWRRQRDAERQQPRRVG